MEKSLSKISNILVFKLIKILTYLKLNINNKYNIDKLLIILFFFDYIIFCKYNFTLIDNKCNKRININFYTQRFNLINNSINYNNSINFIKKKIKLIYTSFRLVILKDNDYINNSTINNLFYFKILLNIFKKNHLIFILKNKNKYIISLYKDIIKFLLLNIENFYILNNETCNIIPICVNFNYLIEDILFNKIKLKDLIFFLFLLLINKKFNKIIFILINFFNLFFFNFKKKFKKLKKFNILLFLKIFLKIIKLKKIKLITSTTLINLNKNILKLKKNNNKKINNNNKKILNYKNNNKKKNKLNYKNNNKNIINYIFKNFINYTFKNFNFIKLNFNSKKKNKRLKINIYLFFLFICNKLKLKFKDNKIILILFKLIIKNFNKIKIKAVFFILYKFLYKIKILYLYINKNSINFNNKFKFYYLKKWPIIYNLSLFIKKNINYINKYLYKSWYKYNYFILYYNYNLYFNNILNFKFIFNFFISNIIFTYFLNNNFKKLNKLNINYKFNIKSPLKKLNEFRVIIKNRVFGQSSAINSFTQSLTKYLSGLKENNKPFGGWVFAGLSGTGKTELTKSLAKSDLFNNNIINLLKIDMSEYSERHSLSKLIGTPPGYVGFNEPGKLMYFLNKNKNNYSIILFDEIEKAHPEICDILLQILDEGIVTDSKNNIGDFSKSFIILTTNLGCNKITELEFPSIFENSKYNKIIYKKYTDSIINGVLKFFKPEIFNRFTEIVIFKPLNFNALYSILDKFLKILLNKINNICESITFTLNEYFKKFMILNSYRPLYGARPLKQIIENLIEKPIAITLLYINIKKKYLYNINFILSRFNFKFIYNFNAVLNKKYTLI